MKLRAFISIVIVLIAIIIMLNNVSIDARVLSISVDLNFIIDNNIDND